jgi:hypothetical protein
MKGTTMKLSIPIAKIGQSVDIDWVKLTGGNETDATRLESLVDSYGQVRYALFNGFKQSLNDAHASPKITREQVMGVVLKKLDSIYADTIKTRGRATAGGLEPIPAECNRIAKAVWAKKTETERSVIIGKTRGQHDSLTDKTDDELVALILAAYAKAPETVAKATATVAAKAMKPAVEIDLSAIGLAE